MKKSKKPEFTLIVILMLSILTYFFSWIIGAVIALLYHEMFFELQRFSTEDPMFLLSTFFIFVYFIGFLLYPPFSMYRIQKGSNPFLLTKNVLNILMFFFYFFFIISINFLHILAIYANFFLVFIIFIHIINTYLHFSITNHSFFTKKTD
jgi:hypothetical protein